jgi:hypothetical protein
MHIAFNQNLLYTGVGRISNHSYFRQFAWGDRNLKLRGLKFLRIILILLIFYVISSFLLWIATWFYPVYVDFPCFSSYEQVYDQEERCAKVWNSSAGNASDQKPRIEYYVSEYSWFWMGGGCDSESSDTNQLLLSTPAKNFSLERAGDSLKVNTRVLAPEGTIQRVGLISMHPWVVHRVEIKNLGVVPICGSESEQKRLVVAGYHNTEISPLKGLSLILVLLVGLRLTNKRLKVITLEQSSAGDSTVQASTRKYDANLQPWILLTALLVLSIAIQSAFPVLRDELLSVVLRVDKEIYVMRKGVLSGRIVFTSARDDNFEIYMMNADGSNQVNLTNSPGTYDVMPDWSPDGSQIVFLRAEDRGSNLYILNADGSGLRRLTTGPASKHDPDWSPDGTQIAFSGDNDIYIINVDGSGLRQLTNTAEGEGEPAWSPDGKKIAFTWGSKGVYAVHVVNVDGSGEQYLSEGESPAWSPDGKRIAFVSDRDGNDEIYVMRADGSKQINLTQRHAHETSPTWSPDGKKIAYASFVNIAPDIYVMNSDGTDAIRLTKSPEPSPELNDEPSWAR